MDYATLKRKAGLDILNKLSLMQKIKMNIGIFICEKEFVGLDGYIHQCDLPSNHSAQHYVSFYKSQFPIRKATKKEIMSAIENSTRSKVILKEVKSNLLK